MKHYSVLLNETIDGLKIKPNGIYVDATLGYGGMSKKILANLNNNGLLIAIDQDEQARIYANEVLKQVNTNYKIIADNFVNLEEILKKLGIYKIDGIIFDLGFSSPQIDEDERGFSFMSDALLDMRMDLSKSLTANKVVNTYSEEELITNFYRYGEEPRSKIIAKKIVAIRKNKPIERTMELVEVIKSATGANYFYKHHPERRIFQALRIMVNNELEVLEKVLPQAINLLKPSGRICVISFHSLEDRIVKNVFKKHSEVDEVFKGMPYIPEEQKAKLKIINKKPILPSEKELQENPRSHSAKLRIGEKI